MSNRTYRFAPPQQVYDSYKAIRNSNLILNKSLTDTNISELQKHLNASQPKSEEESMTRSLIQYLYRKNPTNFCKYLVRSRLSHLILWTEAKCIVRHFGLRGVVYIKWNDQEYECSRHRNVNNNQGDMEHPSVQRTYDNVGSDYGRYLNRSQHQGSRGNGDNYETDRYDIRNRGNRSFRGRKRSNYDSHRYNRKGVDSNQYSTLDSSPNRFEQSSENDFPILPHTTHQNTPVQSPRKNVNSDGTHSKYSFADVVSNVLSASIVLPEGTTDCGVTYSKDLQDTDQPDGETDDKSTE